MNALAVDLGGTQLRIARFGPDRALGPIAAAAHGAGPDRPLSVADVATALQEAIARVEADGVAVGAIGISVAGTVDREAGVVLVADNLGWRDLPLAPLLTAALGRTVRVDTDTLCGAAAEVRLGGSAADALYVAVGTGIGHAWILDGAVWRGHRGAATMLGHLVVDPGGPRCPCGNRGCLCQYAGGPAIVARARRRTGVAGIATAADVVRLAGAGDAAAREVLGEASAALAFALADALTLINPAEMILVGGVVGEEWPDLPALTERVTALVPPSVRPVCLRRSALRDGANLLGAGLLVEAID